jgi:hypothetical protein
MINGSNFGLLICSRLKMVSYIQGKKNDHDYIQEIYDAYKFNFESPFEYLDEI